MALDTDSSSRSITVAPSPCHCVIADSTTNPTPRRLSRSRSGQSAEVRTISRPTKGSGGDDGDRVAPLGEMPGGAASAPRAGVVEHDHPMSGPGRGAHHVLDREDVGPVDSGEPVDGRKPALPAVAGGLRSGREDHGVGVEVLDLGGLDQGIEPHRDLELGELGVRTSR